MKIEPALEYYWRLLKCDLRDRDYFSALCSAYQLMLLSVVCALLFVTGLPFLLPALFIMLVAKFQNRKQ